MRANTSFQKWPLNNVDGTTSLQGTGNRPNVDGDVLVDFVADPDITSVGVPSCPSSSYKRTPVATSTNPSTSFFACVRNEADSAGLNQDVIIFLRGNPLGKTGIFTVTNNQLPTLQSQVIARGVLDKTPPQ